jgi:hypothetical protein
VFQQKVRLSEVWDVRTHIADDQFALAAPAGFPNPAAI